MIVLNTGAEGHPFSSRLPFSWEIIHLVHEILHAHIEDKGSILLSAVSYQIRISNQKFTVHWYSFFIFILLRFETLSFDLCNNMHRQSIRPSISLFAVLCADHNTVTYMAFHITCCILSCR